LVQAAICREKAQADPAHYDHWIDEAIVWLQRAVVSGQKSAVTHEIQGGRMIPTQVHQVMPHPDAAKPRSKSLDRALSLVAAFIVVAIIIVAHY